MTNFLQIYQNNFIVQLIWYLLALATMYNVRRFVLHITLLIKVWD